MLTIPIRTKIVATIGPVCESEKMLKRLKKAGMSVARINLSHGTIKENKTKFTRIRKLLPTTPIIMDLEGPRVRIGEMTKPVELLEGDHFTLTTDAILGTRSRVSVSLKTLPGAVTKDQRIFVNDGIIELRVDKVEGNDVHTTVLTGGPLSSRKGVNIPGTELGMLVPTQQDLEHLRFIAELGADYVAISAVKRRSEVETVEEFLRGEGVKIPIISKIEHSLAVDNFNDILEASNAVMVARGDLGVEVPPEQVPLLQKSIIRKCNRAGKPVIVATQMLESMVKDIRPTRAETSDVANAILDGADALMLSAETAVGKHPIEAVRVMEKIGRYVEGSYPRRRVSHYQSGQHEIAEELGEAVVTLEEHLGIGTILVITQAGYTSRMVSKFRPRARIVSITPHLRVLRQLKLLWGVECLLMDPVENTDQMLKEAVERVTEEQILTPEDRIIVVSGSVLSPGKTNILGVFTVKDILQAQVLK